ncbi:MAG TPA: hypothetical protein DCM86_02240 [Verrucomicrobiales bacterium]|nr:hypothetical protein [Verrucomicrobiales bacterium]
MDSSPRTISLLAGLAIAAAGPAAAQVVRFDFDNAPVQTSLPISLTVDGLTALLSATGQGFSIQQAGVMGFTPAGFSGLAIYPNSIFGADLLIGFSLPVTNFSILYSPQELGCDDSARMKVTGYADGVYIGSNTATASNPGTWPTERLTLSSPDPFNSVVIHYDARPPTCQDYGGIFMADNMEVVLAPPPIVITSPVARADGTFQFDFTAAPGGTYRVVAAPSLSLPLTAWTQAGIVTETSPGQYRFEESQALSFPRRFYRVRSP